MALLEMLIQVSIMAILDKDQAINKAIIDKVMLNKQVIANIYFKLEDNLLIVNIPVTQARFESLQAFHKASQITFQELHLSYIDHLSKGLLDRKMEVNYYQIDPYNLIFYIFIKNII